MSNVYLLGCELITGVARSYDGLSYLLQHSHSPGDNKNDNKKSEENIFNNYFGPRYLKKIDNSVQHAVYSAEMLLSKSKLSEKKMHSTGICLGNNYAGWAYVEHQMHGLYKGDPDAINPYVATAWFPAAAQGEISIRNKLFGHSKTFSLDQLSSAIAFEYAVDLLQTHKLNYVLAGGYESLVSPIIVSALQSEKLISANYTAAQGACMVLLSNQVEDKDNAIAEVVCFEKGNDLLSLLSKIKNNFSKRNIDYCMLPPLDIDNESKRTILNNECHSLAACLENSVTVGMPTYCFGEMSGASFALQLGVALWMLEKQCFPYSYWQHVTEQNRYPATKPLQQIMIIGRDYYAEQYCISIIKKQTNNKQQTSNHNMNKGA